MTATPVATPPGGFFTTKPQYVVLTQADGKNIYYTLDGSDPRVISSGGGGGLVEHPIPGTQDWSASAIAPDGTIYFGSYSSTLYKSTDNGATWVALDHPWDRAWACMLVDWSGILYLAAHSGHIYTSEDGGATLVLRQETSENWMTGWVNGAGQVYFAGYNGTITRCENGAPHLWQNIASPDDQWMCSTYNPSGHVYLAGHAGHVWVSTDGGATWAQTASGFADWWTLVSGPNGEVYVTMHWGYIYKSTDHGLTWTALTGYPLSPWTHAVLASDGTLYYGSYGQDTIYTKDGGITWSTLSGPTAWLTAVADSEGRVYFGSQSVWSWEGSAETIIHGTLYTGPISISSEKVLKAVSAGSAIGAWEFYFRGALPKNLLPLDGITFNTQKNDGAFTPELSVPRRTNGPGRAVFTTSLRFALWGARLEAFKDWFDQHPGGTLLFSQFPLGGGNIDFISTAAPVYTNTHSGVEASVEGKAVPYWPWLGVGGEREILPVVCPFPLGPVSGLTDGSVQPMVGTSGTEHSVAVASARMVGLRLSLNMSPDCMAWFMQWWSDFTAFGRKKFIASIGDRAAWLWRFASEPVFSMNGLVATASFSLQGRPTSQVLDVGRVASPVPTSFTSFLGGTFDPARTYCAQAFDSNGDPVDPRLFIITEQTTTYLKLESSLPVGTYRYVVYGASRISPWYFLEVRTFGH